MNWMPLLLSIMILVILNALIFYFFKVNILKKQNPAIRFLGFNLPKDVVWLVVSLVTLGKSKTEIVILMLVFVALNFLLYWLVIRAINES